MHCFLIKERTICSICSWLLRLDIVLECPGDLVTVATNGVSSSEEISRTSPNTKNWFAFAFPRLFSVVFFLLGEPRVFCFEVVFSVSETKIISGVALPTAGLALLIGDKMEDSRGMLLLRLRLLVERVTGILERERQ